MKLALEDIADNLFHPDPYYRQGGDMVRTGGLTYTLNPRAAAGERISNMQLKEKRIEADRAYRVAGWASVADNEPVGKPVWEVLRDYLSTTSSIHLESINVPTLL